LQAGLVVLPPTVVSEILSDPHLPQAVELNILQIPQLPLSAGFWERVGHFRRSFLKKKIKCRLADALIAQSCI